MILMLSLYLNTIGTEVERKRFEEVYYQHRKQMVFIANAVVHNMDDAEDVVQDVFFTIASSHMDILTKIEDPTDLKNYMLKATKNKAISTLRRQKIQKECENKFIDFNLEFNDSVFVESVCAKVEYDELLDAIRSLDDKYREVLYYKIVLDLSVEQIASTVDRTESTVCKQIYRGKKMLAEMLKRGEMAECL